MKSKIVGILVVMLLIATAFPVIGITEENENKAVNIAINEDFSILSNAINNFKCDPIFKSNIVLSLMALCNYENGDVLDQQQNSNCGYGWHVLENQWLAQGFKPSMEILTRVKLCMFKAGNPPEDIDIIVSIRDSLDGSDLVSKSIDASFILSGWIEFDFSDIDVIPGERYYIVCRANGGYNYNCYCWLFDVNDPYNKGDAWCSNDKGLTWFTAESPGHPETDFCFKTYGQSDEPLKPDAPEGEINGKINIEYTYTAVTTDFQNDQIYYLFDWGDGEFFGWVGPENSGQTASASHTWEEQGDYQIRVMAKDENGFESPWSDPLAISMPKNKIINPFERFLENHPNLFPLLRYLLDL